jgi:CRISPR system Cascade subunit CasA
MKFSFDLVHEPWIPCVDLRGQQKSLGLEAVLVKAHELQCVRGQTPPVTAAVLFVLLAILYRNFDPKNEQTWLDLWRRGKFDATTIKMYLKKWQDRFDLFHPDTPFYQHRAEVTTKSINSLQMHMAAGRTETLFEHSVEGKVALRPAEAALALIAMQAFGLTGVCDLSRELFYKDAPCARGVVSFLSGETLFETLMLNLVGNGCGYSFEKAKADQPAWEADNVFSPERTVPQGCLDFLTWQSRRILLLPEEEDGTIVVRSMTTAPGLLFESQTQNPFYCYHLNENVEKKYLRFGENKAFWRDSAALLSFDAEEIFAPRAFQWFSEVSKQMVFDKDKIAITALGTSTEPGKTKIRFYRTERMVFPTALVSDPALRSALQIGIGYVEYANRMLWAALNKMSLMKLSSVGFQEDLPLINAPKDTWVLTKVWGSQDFFWKNLEKHFHLFIEALLEDKTKAISDWNKAVHELAWQALEHAGKMSGGEGAEHLKIIVRAKVILFNGLKQIPVDAKRELKREISSNSPLLQKLFGNNNIDPVEVRDILHTSFPGIDTDNWYEIVSFLIADLYNLYPQNSSKGNMGNHFHAGAPFGRGQEQIYEKRFILLLSVTRSELPLQLPGVVNILKERKILVNWPELTMDLLNWNATDQHVQKKWAEAFWGFGISFPYTDICQNAHLVLE